jgi:hypothetical protein
MCNPATPSKFQRLSCIAAFTILGAGMQSCFAFGLDEVYSPNAEYGEISLEVSHARTFDGNPAKDAAKVGEVTLEAGITPRVVLAVSGEYSADPGNAMQLDASQIEGRYQFFESGEQWMDVGALVSYSFSKQTDTPDSLEVKLLLQKDVGRFTHTANIGFNQNVGTFPNLTDGADYTFLWSTRYRYSEYIQPGFEIQSDLGPGSQTGYFNQQEHYMGPSIQGKILGHLKYQVAYLFGVSDLAAQQAVRLNLEYEMNF